ncbi:hypothetical protein SSCH_550020 [Syntrophaceticus schinkii]|uniref:Small acid-soluble spore protein alpha/beta type n=1 Tax=Syntrophaceticus schinkii TaxID=499207 RepID=A0A0B7MHX9_9FIRM|nr:alpha/beta-type small acid-soluble spore protein [Syntrophaceticus schinkii]CEO89665.1 hypothetical protein SSCH_550020 [Syntrophaceticus schinkii]
MGQGQKRNTLLVPEANKAMYQFKYEMANEVGITNQIQGDYWGHISSRDCGAVGGGYGQADDSAVSAGSCRPAAAPDHNPIKKVQKEK